MKTKLTHLDGNGHLPAPAVENPKSPLDTPGSETSNGSAQSRIASAPLCELRPFAVDSSPSHRTGKIARLPAEARAEVNTMLRNGYRHLAIVKKLAELGHSDISVNSIHTWKYGGFV